MVRRPRLDLDETLLEDWKKPRAKGERKPVFRGDRTDRALIVVMIIAVVMLVLLALTVKKESWWAVFLIGLMFLASELFGLPMKTGGRLSLALLPVVMAMMVSGALGAAVVALFGIPIFCMERGEEGVRRVVYNACQYLFSAGAAAWVFHHIGGAVLKQDISNGSKLIIPWLLATVVFFVFNTILVTPVLAQPDERMPRFWQRRLLNRFPGYLLYSGIGFLAAIVYNKLEFAGVVLLFAPLLGIRVVYTRYGRMRDVCDDTTLSVMEAVESGEIFREGHSVGVADISVAIAEEMNFLEEEIHYLKQAALLHDVGKLALDPSVVEKPGMLTPEEFEEVKKHPLISGSIAEREASLSVVAPAIVHHHETYDGNGYVDGLSGDTIPLGARILAVADAFDAMQRPSPYREQLDSYRAASEIIRAKGVQFDPDVVDAFIKVVMKRGLWTGALRDKVRMPEAKAFVQPALPVDTDQPTLEEAVSGTTAEGEAGRTATPGGGIAYSQVRGEIEKDIKEWERAEGGKERQRDKGKSRRRAGSFRRKKAREGKGPQGEKEV